MICCYSHRVGTRYTLVPLVGHSNTLPFWDLFVLLLPIRLIFFLMWCHKKPNCPISTISSPPLPHLLLKTSIESLVLLVRKVALPYPSSRICRMSKWYLSNLPLPSMIAKKRLPVLLSRSTPPHQN